MDWQRQFPELAALEPAAADLLAGRARVVRFPAGRAAAG